MDYSKYAEELLSYVIQWQKTNGRVIQNNIAEITHGELAVLIFLMDEKDGASAIELSRKLEVNTSRIAAILNSLTKKGYVVREPHAEDNRKIRVFITQKGKAYCNHRKAKIIESMAKLLSELGEEDAKEYVRLVGSAANKILHLSLK